MISINELNSGLQLPILCALHKDWPAEECPECNSRVSVELYNQICAEYREESRASRCCAVIAWQRWQIIGLEKTDPLAEQSLDQEWNHIKHGKCHTRALRTQMGLYLMYKRGLEIGFRLGQAVARLVPEKSNSDVAKGPVAGTEGGN
jgi:hypothetical protein